MQFSIHDGDILTDINSIPRTISISTNVLYTISAIATNRIGDSARGTASSTSFGTPNPPSINNIQYSENAIIIYFTHGDDNGSTINGLKYSINDQPYVFIPNATSPLIIYATPNIDVVVKLITSSNNGDSKEYVSNVINIPDPLASRVREAVFSSDKTEVLNTLGLLSDIEETPSNVAISSDDNTNIMKFINAIQDSTSTISAEGSLRSAPLNDDLNLPIIYPNRATTLVRKYYQKQLRK